MWLTPHAAVVCESDRAFLVSSFLLGDYRFHIFSFNVDGKDIFAVAPNAAALSEIVDVVHRLLVANARDVNPLTLKNLGNGDGVFFNAPTLAYLVEHCQNLKDFNIARNSLG